MFVESNFYHPLLNLVHLRALLEQENNIFFEIENIYTIIMEKIAILGLQTLHLKIAMPPQLFGNMLVLNYLNYTLCIAR